MPAPDFTRLSNQALTAIVEKNEQLTKKHAHRAEVAAVLALVCAFISLACNVYVVWARHHQ